MTQVLFLRDKDLQSTRSCALAKVIWVVSDEILQENPGLLNSSPRLPLVYKITFLLLQKPCLSTPLMQIFEILLIIILERNRRISRRQCRKMSETENCKISQKEKRGENTQETYPRKTQRQASSYSWCPEQCLKCCQNCFCPKWRIKTIFFIY